ncbi:hypothetical protein [Catenovulum sediminis]|uniref:Uncharacterized protein n=1 Tax=Catenovulum sediminis TaxID=1740262 RepID=A0ABV1RHN3_9ALTE|nr:hypothetical protein [Catenovulum sediminis]
MNYKDKDSKSKVQSSSVETLSIEGLNHAYTPPELALLNTQLVEIINEDELDSANLLKLIEQRDELIQGLLDTFKNLEQQKEFALAERDVNNRLITLCNQLFKQSESALMQLVKGQKAIKKYKK